MTFWVLNIQNDQLALKKNKTKQNKTYIERARTQTKLYIVAYEACYIPLHYSRLQSHLMFMHLELIREE